MNRCVPNDLCGSLAPQEPKTYLARRLLDAVEYNQYTPDALELDMHPYHLVFLYDNYRQGKPHNEGITRFDAQLIGRSKTLFPYEMYANPDIDPVILNRDIKFFGQTIAPIIGELWLVDTSVLRGLDTFYCNTCLYSRSKQPVRILAQPEVEEYAGTYVREYDAWVYEGKLSFWARHIIKGNISHVPEVMCVQTKERYIEHT